MTFKSLVYSPDVHTVDLHIDGQSYKAIMKDIQFHAVNDSILHIDFLELHDDKPVTMQIPVKLTGSAVGVKQGGNLVNKMRLLTISALPANLPDNVQIKIDDLGIGMGVRVRDMQMEGVEFLDSPNNVIVAVKTARTVVEEAPAAAAAAAAAPAAAAAEPAKK
jgi:large subunit ribosomal protein L25